MPDRYSISIRNNVNGHPLVFGCSRYGGSMYSDGGEHGPAKILVEFEPGKQFGDLVQEVVASGFCNCPIEAGPVDGEVRLSVFRQDGAPVAADLAGPGITDFLACAARAKSRLKVRENRGFDGILHH